MKQIKCSVFILAVMAISASAKAQSTTGTTNLHVNIVDALSITVNTTDVTLTFTTPADYQNGRDSTINSHLTVTSNQAYDITVKAASAELSNAGGDKINTNSVTVEIPAGQTDLGTLNSAALSTSDFMLISGGTAAVNKNINVKYSIPNTISSTSAILGKPAGDYETVLTYTITQ